MSERRVKKKTGEPIPAHVVRKFKEANDKAAFDARVRELVDFFNEFLEKRSMANHRVTQMNENLTRAVEERFTKAGWKVAVTAHDQGYSEVTFTITLD